MRRSLIAVVSLAVSSQVNAAERLVELVIQDAQVPSTVTDFPVLIARANLPNEVLDPSGSNNAQADGGDLQLFSDEAMMTRLPLDVVTFEHDTTTNAGDAVIEIWTLAPTVNGSADTSLWLRYNPAGTESQPATSASYGRDEVWQDYAAVYHANEASGDLTDSTGNGNTAADVNTPGYSETGKIGAGVSSEEASDSHFAAPHAASFDFSAVTGYTVQMWIDLAGSQANWSSPYSKGDSTDDDWSIGRFNNTDDLTVYNNGTPATITGGWAAFAGSGLSKLDVTWNTTDDDAYLYQDGALFGSAAQTEQPVHNTGRSFRIGATRDAGSDPIEVDAILDEIRVIGIPLSADWFATEYNNQNSPSTFIVEGSPADISGGGSAVPAIIQQFLH